MKVLINGEVKELSDSEAGSLGLTTPSNAPPLVVPVITYKADVWRRVTDVQAGQLDTEIQKLGVRERNLWSDSTYLDHSDPFVTMLKEAMVEQWGQAETDRILAPSEG